MGTAGLSTETVYKFVEEALADALEDAVVEGLHPQRQPVEARLPQVEQHGQVEGARIHLDGDLEVPAFPVTSAGRDEERPVPPRGGPGLSPGWR